ncbi:hypothetical protein ACIOJD_14760 [Streptomyces sp. NPDC088116]|uniref:hypothetical protein n=1 Tax=Streptomyces sp. NPDC088116 TaxID=3365825 RepID=UPI00381A1C80
MLPTEPPLSLHRLVAPTPPARVQDSGTAAVPVQQRPAATAEATPVAAHAKPPTALEHMLLVGQNQVGNAAVAGAAARTSPVTPPVVVVAPASKPKAVQSP